MIKSADRRSSATPRRDPGRRPGAGRAGCDPAGRAGAQVLLERGGVDAAQHRLHRPDLAGRQREVADAEADQRHGLERPARHLAADREPHARRPAALGPCRGRSSRPAARARRSGRPAPGCPVAGEQELEQVVAADRDEVDPLEQRRSTASRATAPPAWRRPRSARQPGPRAAARAISMSRRRRAASSSATSATIGNITCSVRPAAALSRARSWPRRMVGRSSAIRSARQPMAGLSSGGMRQ